MPSAGTSRSTRGSAHLRKRGGQHHAKSKHYLKTYWPYIPIALIVGLGLFMGNYRPHMRNGVLAYATQMSVDTLLTSTNSERSAHGQSNLQLNSKLAAAAQAKANDMAARNYWSHNTPDGNEPWVFVQGSGYQYAKAGENLAYGFNTSGDTVVGWMNSASHRENLLDANYQEVGFGFANAKNYNNAGPETIVVAMYGTPIGTTIADSPSHPQAVTSLTPVSNEPATMGVARIQTLTGAQIPFVTFAIGALCGGLAALVAFKHGVALRRLIRDGEWYITHHPMMDIAIVAVIMIGYVLLQTDGMIR